MVAKTLPARVGRLESKVAVIENDLEHGSTIFHRLEEKMDALDSAFRKHMAREERLLVKIGGWALAGAISIILGLIAYIWKTNIG